MYKVIVFTAIFCLLFYSFFEVYAQQPQLATFQETAQVIIDQQSSNNVTASITLQSTNNQEIQIPSTLEEKILENERIIAIVLTSEKQCVLGVRDESCIMINVSRDLSEKGIIEVQEGARQIGDSLIDSLNEVFDTSAEFHSVYIHQTGEANRVLETSGVISGKGTISAVYTMPLEETESMYTKISSMLIHQVIRDSGGFYETAKKLSSEPNSAITFSMIPRENSFLYQLKLSVSYPNSADIDVISPLEFLKIDVLKKSNYFSDGFYPLNSILQVVVLSSELTNVNEVNANVLQTQIIGGDKMPVELSQDGWFFDPESGNKIEGKYLFGHKFSLEKNELVFTLGMAQTNQVPPSEIPDFDESVVILILIVIVAGGATAFYLKGYKK